MIRCITLHCNSQCHSPGFFTLADVYAHASSLAKLHPNNRHVRDKIRQQLQILRDMGLVEFLGAENTGGGKKSGVEPPHSKKDAGLKPGATFDSSARARQNPAAVARQPPWKGFVPGSARKERGPGERFTQKECGSRLRFERTQELGGKLRQARGQAAYNFVRFLREDEVFARGAVGHSLHAKICRFKVFHRFHPNGGAQKIFPEYIEGSGSHRGTLLTTRFRTGFGGHFLSSILAASHRALQNPRLFA